MITPTSQRWRDGRARFIPPDDCFKPERYEVTLLGGNRLAKPFIQQHHYSGTYPAARFRYGLYQSGVLVGVCVFSHPAHDAVLAHLPGSDRMAKTELGRLVLLDDVPFNAETWFIARCFTLLRREGIESVVSFSDPVQRTAIDGRVVFRGHVGQIYQASNAVYTGRATSRTVRLLPDGSVLHARALAKIRAKHQGWQYSARMLEAFGAPTLSASADRIAWLKEWLPRLTRALPHEGNHRYLFAVDKRVRKHMPPSLPYPRITPPA